MKTNNLPYRMTSLSKTGLSIKFFPVLLLLFALTAAGTTFPTESWASVHMVDTLTDENDGNCGDGGCSLRDAIEIANMGDSIDLSAMEGTIELVLGELELSTSLTIIGPTNGSLTISGNNLSRVFNIEAGKTMKISNLTISNGKGTNGGGIYNSGKLTVTNCTISGNTASNGGGIYNSDDAEYNHGKLTVTNCTISGNTAISGGGILNNGTLTVESGSTISSNSASDGGGGGIFNAGTLALNKVTVSGNTSLAGGGGICNFGGITITNSTISDNTASEGGGIMNSFLHSLTITNSTISGNTAGSGGGGISDLGFLTITNSTISGNTASDGGGLFSGDDIGWFELYNVTIYNNTASDGNAIKTIDAWGSIENSIVAGGCSFSGHFTTQSDGYNIETDTSCGLNGDGDLQNTVPLLYPLADNGGPTLTHALQPGSPAMDAGNNATAEGTDQRGVNRPQDGDNDGTAVSDIGAFESPTEIIQFSASEYRAAEGAGSVTITVTRIGRADNTASVDYTTSDGTALAGIDYTAASGTLNWDHGETASKAFTVFITDDSEVEPDETLTLTLSNFTGTPIASPSSIPLTIHQPVTHVVNTLTDENDGDCGDGGCSLRDAIQIANNGDAIDLSSITGTIELVLGELYLSKDLTITGPTSDALTIGDSRVFNIATGTTVSISNLNIKGNSRNGILNNGELTLNRVTVSGYPQTGIRNYGGLTVINSTISGNKGDDGGGICNTGSLTVKNSTISGNKAYDGGGIFNTGNLTVKNSTISGNEAYGHNKGGGYDGHGGGIRNSGSLTVINSTISGNTASSDNGDGKGGGIYNTAFFTLNNITIYNNTAEEGSAINATDSGSITNSIVAGGCSGVTHTSLGNNIETDTTCGLNGPGDLQNTDPLLRSLGGNGGPTFTHALETGSPAIDAGNNATAEDTDQRYTERPQNGAKSGPAVSDIGAFELSPGTLQFSASAYRADKNDGSVTITVTRTGGPDNAASVDYATSDGTALEGIDYTAASGTLNWSRGEGGSKTFTVFITNNGQAEPDKTVILTLSNFTGALTGSPSSATLTINQGIHVVDTSTDENDGDCGDGGCSLRDAIQIANNGDAIDLSSITGTIELVLGELYLSKDLTITGPTTGSLTISGNNASRVFNIAEGATISISNLTISDGQRDGGGGGIFNAGTLALNKITVSGNTSSAGGGGICNFGTLTVKQSTISGNTASGMGGGIENSFFHSLTITDSTISGNSAGSGGGISDLGFLTVTNSTISGNSATEWGGGIYNLMDFDTWGSLNNVTIYNNKAGIGNAIHANSPGSITNSIVAGGCSGVTQTSLGNNIETDTTCGLDSPGDLQNTDPLLYPLADNGGPTFTHALQSGSPAIDAGNDATAEDTDQRSVNRPQDGDNDGSAMSDIGAYEHIPAPAAPGTLQFSESNYSAAEGAGSVTITVTRTGGSDGAASVDYATSGGTALEGIDYTAASGTLNWDHGETASKTFTVTITNDSQVESHETFTITLSNFTNALTGTTSSVPLTIANDDDPAPPPPRGTLQFSTPAYSAGEKDGSITVTVARTGGSYGSASVDYATSNGTATLGYNDYTKASGTLNWSHGETASKAITVTITDDSEVEPDETLTITLSNFTGAPTGTPSLATLTIIDNDNDDGDDNDDDEPPLGDDDEDDDDDKTIPEKAADITKDLTDVGLDSGQSATNEQEKTVNNLVDKTVELLQDANDLQAEGTLPTSDAVAVLEAVDDMTDTAAKLSDLDGDADGGAVADAIGMVDDMVEGMLTGSESPTEEQLEKIVGISDRILENLPAIIVPSTINEGRDLVKQMGSLVNAGLSAGLEADAPNVGALGGMIDNISGVVAALERDTSITGNTGLVDNAGKTIGKAITQVIGTGNANDILSPVTRQLQEESSQIIDSILRNILRNDTPFSDNGSATPRLVSDSGNPDGVSLDKTKKLIREVEELVSPFLAGYIPLDENVMGSIAKLTRGATEAVIDILQKELNIPKENTLSRDRESLDLALRNYPRLLDALLEVSAVDLTSVLLTRGTNATEEMPLVIDPEREVFTNGLLLTPLDVLSAGLAEAAPGMTLEVDPEAGTVTITSGQEGEGSKHCLIISRMHMISTDAPDAIHSRSNGGNSAALDGMHPCSNGSLTFGKDDLIVTVIPVIYGILNYYRDMESTNMNFNISNDGIWSHKLEGNRFASGVFDWASNKSNPTGSDKIDVKMIGDPNNPENYTVQVTHPDGYVQNMPPCVYLYNDFQNYLKARGIYLNMDKSTGILCVGPQGRFKADFFVEPSSKYHDGPPFSWEIGDFNNDNLPDFKLFTPENVQTIYGLPPSP